MDDPRRHIVDRYMHGECMVMAATLSRILGAPTVGIYDAMWTTVPRHVGVEVAPGVYADARGIDLDRAAFLDGYQHGDAYVAPIGPDDMRRIWGRRITSWDVPDEHLAALGLPYRSLAA